MLSRKLLRLVESSLESGDEACAVNDLVDSHMIPDIYVLGLGILL